MYFNIFRVGSFCNSSIQTNNLTCTNSHQVMVAHALNPSPWEGGRSLSLRLAWSTTEFQVSQSYKEKTCLKNTNKTVQIHRTPPQFSCICVVVYNVWYVHVLTHTWAWLCAWCAYGGLRSTSGVILDHYSTLLITLSVKARAHRHY